VKVLWQAVPVTNTELRVGDDILEVTTGYEQDSGWRDSFWPIGSGFIWICSRVFRTYFDSVSSVSRTKSQAKNNG
jgi:hypothetical protein